MVRNDLFQDEELDAIEYADSVFRSVRYHCNQIQRYGEQLDMIAIRLSGTVRSPRIVSREEAKYQRGTRIYHNNIAELITDEQETAQLYRASEAVIYELAAFLRDYCSQEEIDIICLYYDLRMPLWLIGEKLHYSKDTIRRIRNKVLAMYTSCATALEKV